ncbi:hypothetical protein H696_02265 [Fonticula alba]|uniref:NAD(P)-binding domain-containing protein n=1 Tax=Fonticula alba TaxID=691883 RepID=A0A058ZAE3_FONAL|nr:hypothetical protein H696_02265 [Fonticula alba]KCV71319.1 hypothetical protein H696_02265 [Fonticula alba]|eukprot:XP_009494442.1 hypothetical protein H696_02265 [Fonticula alba]
MYTGRTNSRKRSSRSSSASFSGASHGTHAGAHGQGSGRGRVASVRGESRGSARNCVSHHGRSLRPACFRPVNAPCAGLSFYITPFISAPWPRSWIHGNGTHSRRYLYVTDAVRAFEAVMQRGALGDTYNIAAGPGCERTTLEVGRACIHFVDQSLGQGTPAALADHHANDVTMGGRLVFVRDRACNDQRYHVDSRKVQALGWEPEVSFEEGLQRTGTAFFHTASVHRPRGGRTHQGRSPRELQKRGGGRSQMVVALDHI